MILLTTPTGDIGARVLDRLLNTGAPVRVIVRDPSRLPPDVRSRVDLVRGSHSDAATIGAALDGVDRVFWLPPGDPTAADAHAAYVTFSKPFAEALPASDVTHVVGISAVGRGWAKPAGLASASVVMDDLIAATGVAYGALACASLMDNLMRQIEVIRDGAFYAPTPGDLPLPHVAKADVAAVAARLLLSPDWTGFEDIPLHGPQEVSFDEIASILSDILGHPVAFREMSMDAFSAMLRSIGTSEGMIRDYTLMMTEKNEGMDTPHPGTSRDDTPTSFRTWAERELRPAILNHTRHLAPNDEELS
ncbi:NAD(P)H-binding protein [Aestuariibius insulae]|uniref:NAD(P)H-binding protein n=1 Tax=Aestuariibius insulae TaxID=2058287 RepID=UPI00345E28CF